MAEEAGGGAAVLEAGADEGQQQGQGEGEQQQGQESQQQQGGKQGAGAGGDGEQADGRRQPDALRKHLAALKADANTSALAKTITDRVGKTYGYEQAFPTVREAKEVKALIESAGGREGITAAIESHANMQRVDALLAAGDPAVLDDIFEQAPQGMVKLVPDILNRVQHANPEAYAKAITPHAVALMASQGLPGWINSVVDIYDALEQTLSGATPDAAGAKRVLASLKSVLGNGVQWYTGLAAGAKPKGADPERAKLDQDRTAFEEQQASAAVKSTFDTTTAYAGQKIDAALTAEIKRLGLEVKPKALAALRQDVWSEIQKKRNADPVYKSGLTQRFDGKKPKPEAVAYLNGYTDRLLKDAIAAADPGSYGEVKAAVKNVTAAKGAAAGGKNGAAAQTGAVKVTSIPPAKDIDYDDKRTDTFAGRAVLKSTKQLVSWR